MRLQVASTEILSISDTVATLPMSLGYTYPTVSDEEWREIREVYSDTFDGPETLKARIGCSFIRTPERTILVDTGVGPANTAFARFLGTGGELPERLRRLGVDAADIDIVFLTHLHSDHVGWNVREQDGRPTFPNAAYIAPEADWEMCRQRLEHNPQNKPTAYIHENVLPLYERGRLELIDGDGGLSDGVRYVHTPGHTPGQMSLRVESADRDSGRAVWLLGDVAAHPLQIGNTAHSYCFDEDVRLAAETRSRVLEEVENENAVVEAAHFPEPGFGHLVRKGERRYWQPIRA